MNYTYYTLLPEELEEEINKVKIILLNHLLNNKLISIHVYNDMIQNYGIIIKKPSFFSSWWKSRKDVKQYILVKQVNMVVDKEDTASKLNVVKFENK
jgi:hypothetical protein